jgi:hypothetical protein
MPEELGSSDWAGVDAWSGIKRLEFISKKKTRRAIYSLNNSLKIFDVVMHVHTQVFLVVTHATIYLKVYSLICFIRMLN